MTREATAPFGPTRFRGERLKYILTASIFGASLCLNPAQAVEGGGEQAERESEKAAAEREKAPKKDERRPNDLASCKRDATDLHGPERARFMTECLRRRE